MLIDGPRCCGKSIGMHHKVIRHCFDNENACVGIIAKTLKNGKQGTWKQLTQDAIPEWIKAGIGLKWIKEPTMEADTKMSYCKISNRYGGSSEIQLHSLEYENDCSDKFKDMSFTMIHIVESDKHRSREVFDILSLQLRSHTVPDSQMQLICDSNPPSNAKRNWMWEVFVLKSGLTEEDTAAATRIDRIHMTLEDNPKAPPALIESLKATYRHDKTRYQRFIEGAWVEDSEDGHFVDVFRADVHVIGDTTGRDKDQWTTLVPQNTIELLIGFDLGDIYHAAVMMAKRTVKDQCVFDVFDELVVINQKISLADFTEAMLEKMDYWEVFMKEEYKIEKPINWKCWSDTSAMRHRSALGSHEQLEVYKLSNRRIKLHGAFKGKGAISERISLLKKLLFEDRIYFGAQCFNCLDMIRGLRSGLKKIASLKTDDIERGSPFKHVFDAMTYVLAEEAPADLEMRTIPIMRRATSARTDLIVM